MGLRWRVFTEDRVVGVFTRPCYDDSWIRAVSGAWSGMHLSGAFFLELVTIHKFYCKNKKIGFELKVFISQNKKRKYRKWRLFFELGSWYGAWSRSQFSQIDRSLAKHIFVAKIDTISLKNRTFPENESRRKTYQYFEAIFLAFSPILYVFNSLITRFRRPYASRFIRCLKINYLLLHLVAIILTYNLHL